MVVSAPVGRPNTKVPELLWYMACTIALALEVVMATLLLICLIRQLRLIPALPAGDSRSTYDTRRSLSEKKNTFMPKSPLIPLLIPSHSDFSMPKLQRSTGPVKPGSALYALIASITALGSL